MIFDGCFWGQSKSESRGGGGGGGSCFPSTNHFVSDFDDGKIMRPVKPQAPHKNESVPHDELKNLQTWLFRWEQSGGGGERKAAEQLRNARGIRNPKG